MGREGKNGDDERKEWKWTRVERKVENASIAFKGKDVPLQKHGLITRKVIFTVPLVPLGWKKGRINTFHECRFLPERQLSNDNIVAVDYFLICAVGLYCMLHGHIVYHFNRLIRGFVVGVQRWIDRLLNKRVNFARNRHSRTRRFCAHSARVIVKRCVVVTSGFSLCTDVCHLSASSVGSYVDLHAGLLWVHGCLTGV